MIDQQRASEKVTVEDLLRLKRAERPAPEFWVDFERSLRAKQLAALVQKRPWWKTWSGFSRWSIPVGAAAALTVTFVTFSSRTASSRVPIAQADSVRVAVDAPTPVIPAVVAQVESAPAISAEAPEPISETAVARVEPTSHVTPEASDPAVPAGHLASVTEQVAGIAIDADGDVPAARFAATGASAPKSFTFDRAVLAQTDESLRSNRTSSVEPLAQMSTPRDARRARLLAFTSSVDTRTPQYSNSTGVIRSRERIATHLNEEALYDSIRRLGVKDGGVSIQF